MVILDLGEDAVSRITDDLSELCGVGDLGLKRDDGLRGVEGNLGVENAFGFLEGFGDACDTTATAHACDLESDFLDRGREFRRGARAGGWCCVVA